MTQCPVTVTLTITLTRTLFLSLTVTLTLIVRNPYVKPSLYPNPSFNLDCTLQYKPYHNASGGMSQYRSTLSLSFFYKFFLHVQQES